MFKRSSIFFKILYNNLLITLIPLLIGIFIICAFICSNYKNNEIRSTQKSVDEYANKVNSAFAITMKTSENIFKYNYLIDNLNRSHETGMEKMEFNNSITAYMDNITSSLQHTDSIIIYFSDSDVYENKYLQHISRLKNSREIEKQFLLDNSNVFWDDTIYKENGSEKIYFKLYRKTPLSKGCILECKMYIPEAPEALDVEIIKSSELNKSSSIIWVPINQEHIVTAPINYAKINTMYLKYIVLFLVLCLCFILALIYLTYIVTSRVTQDINHFIMQLDEYDVLDLDMSLNAAPNETRELSIIKNTISSLMQKVKNVSDLQYKSELEKRKLELELLQSKIEPHLLYNSLSAIRLKAYKYNSSDTEIPDMIDNMTDYYRSILSKGKKYVTISEEIDMLKHYVYINEVSHNKTYNFTPDIPDELRNKEILHLILQPFVENAIIHGLAGKRQNCEIKISCESNENGIVFTVYDNGYGISPEKLEKLNNTDGNNLGYGIKNVRQRLRLEYGNTCSVIYNSQEDEFTCVTIQIGDKVQ